MPGSTTRRGLPLPVGADLASELRLSITAAANAADTDAIYLSGTLAARSSISGLLAGTFYYATDTGLMYWYNGSAWQTVHLSTFGSGSALFNSASPASSCSGTISHGLPAAPNMVKFTPTNDPSSGTYTAGSPLTIWLSGSSSTTFSWSAIIAGVSNNTLNFAWEATL